MIDYVIYDTVKPYIAKNASEGMEVKVQFDKEQYYPGEIVTAQFMISGPYHGRAREIRMELASGENVGVTYHTGSGNNRRKRTAWSRLVYSRTDHSMAIPEYQSSQTVELNYQLPSFPSDQIDAYEFDVYHHAKVTLDIARGSDENYHFMVPVVSLPPEEMQEQSVTLRSEHFEGKVSNGNGYTGDSISVQLVTTGQKKYRSIRIELEQKLHKFVGRHRSNSVKKYVLATFDPDAMVHTQVEIPMLPYSTISGEAFEILTYLKVVVDVAMGRDENIVFDFPYFKSPRKLHEIAPTYDQKPVKGEAFIFCSNCGTENTPPAKFCDNCGEEILYEE